jgi:hypothetical protein
LLSLSSRNATISSRVFPHSVSFSSLQGGTSPIIESKLVSPQTLQPRLSPSPHPFTLPSFLLNFNLETNSKQRVEIISSALERNELQEKEDDKDDKDDEDDEEGLLRDTTVNSIHRRRSRRLRTSSTLSALGEASTSAVSNIASMTNSSTISGIPRSRADSGIYGNLVHSSNSLIRSGSISKVPSFNNLPATPIALAAAAAAGGGGGGGNSVAPFYTNVVGRERSDSGFQYHSQTSSRSQSRRSSFLGGAGGTPAGLHSAAAISRLGYLRGSSSLIHGGLYQPTTGSSINDRDMQNSIIHTTTSTPKNIHRRVSAIAPGSPIAFFSSNLSSDGAIGGGMRSQMNIRSSVAKL